MNDQKKIADTLSQGMYENWDSVHIIKLCVD